MIESAVMGRDPEGANFLKEQYKRATISHRGSVYTAVPMCVKILDFIYEINKQLAQAPDNP